MFCFGTLKNEDLRDFYHYKKSNSLCDIFKREKSIFLLHASAYKRKGINSGQVCAFCTQFFFIFFKSCRINFELNEISATILRGKKEVELMFDLERVFHLSFANKSHGTSNTP
jgi:hypothetical protein